MSSLSAREHFIFIPGLGDDAFLWRHQVQHLSDVAVPAVADITVADSVPALAKSVLEKAPPKFALCGFSLGGYVSLEILRQAPERVARVALIATNARADTEHRRSERLSTIADAQIPGGFTRIINEQLGEVVAPECLRDTPLTDEIVKMGLRVGQDAFVRQHRACMTRASSLALLNSVRCPTLVICGRQDIVTPIDMSSQIAQGVSGSQFIIIEDAGHYVPLERPQAVTALLRQWLQYS